MKGDEAENALQAEAHGIVGSTFGLPGAIPAYMYTHISATTENPSLILL